MVQIMHKNALVCAIQQVYVCRQVKDYDFSDRLSFFSAIVLFPNCCSSLHIILFAFSSLTLLVGHQEEHLDCNKLTDEVLAWLSVSIKVQMISILSS